MMSDAAAGMETEAVILRAVMRLSRRLRQAAGDSELSGAALGMLATLRRDGAMSAAELARREGLQPQSLTRLLARLEKAGMIERALDRDDRRRQQIAITPKGTDALRRAMGLRLRWLAAAMGERLAGGERERLLASAQLMLRLAE